MKSSLWQRRKFLKQMGLGLWVLINPFQGSKTFKSYNMSNKGIYDVIIVGGSYSGLAAAMALGRALKQVLVIDNNKPCNRQTPHSHNFLTNDGKTPTEIAALANLQVRRYDTVEFFTGTVTSVDKSELWLRVIMGTGEIFIARRVIFATGIKDLFQPIEGLHECWGISVIHCPYCHGYEVRNEKTGILGNGDWAFDFAKLISNWTKDLTLFTNGASSLTNNQKVSLQKHDIEIIEKKIVRVEHKSGHIENLIFDNNNRIPIKAIYAPGPFEQHCKIPQQMGCELTEEGYIKIGDSYETTVKGVYAVGDNASKMRTVANAVSMGTAAGIIISKEMILEEF